MIKEHKGNVKMVFFVAGGSEIDAEQKLQGYLATVRRLPGIIEEHVEKLECRLRRKAKASRLREKMRGWSDDEQRVTRGLEEVRTSKGNGSIVREGDDRCQTNETSRKGKGKGNRGKGEHGNEGGVGSTGTQQVEKLVMEEVQENMRIMKSQEKEKNRREDVRKTVERMQKEEEVRGVVVSCEAEFEREFRRLEEKRKAVWIDGSADEQEGRGERRRAERKSGEKLLGREYLEGEQDAHEEERGAQKARVEEERRTQVRSEQGSEERSEEKSEQRSEQRSEQSSEQSREERGESREERGEVSRVEERESSENKRGELRPTAVRER